MATIFVSATNGANSPSVGGHLWVYLQYGLGLRELGCDVTQAAALGLPVQALAERVQITDAYIAQLKTGVRTNPSLAVLRRLAKALSVDVAELLG
jgi:hypothetical protein